MEKKKLRLLFLYAFSAFLLISCSKYSKMLDFEFDNMEIDGSMNWGIPLINAEYGIEKLLNQFDNMGYISTEPNGNYYFEFNTSAEQYINLEEYNRIENLVQDFTLHFPAHKFSHVFSQNNVIIATKDMKIHEAKFRSGQIKFDFSNVTPHTDLEYDISVTSPSLFNADGTPFVKELSKSNPVSVSNCAGLIMKTENSAMNFDITITLYQPSNVPLLFIFKNSLIDLILEEAEVEVLKNHDQSFVTSSAFSMFTKDPNLQATIHNAQMYLNVVNTFGCDINVRLSKAYVKSETHTESILNNDNALIEIPSNYTGPINLKDFIKKEILLTSNCDSLYFEYVVLIPAGKRIKFYVKSIAEATMKLAIPFDVTIDQATFTDTLTFGLPGLRDLSILDTVKIRTAFTSSIPTGFDVSIVLYNSELKKEIGNLFSKPIHIKGSYNGMPEPSEINYVIITKERIKELQQTDQIIVCLSLNTHGQHYSFNESNCLSVKMGAHIKTATEF